MWMTLLISCIIIGLFHVCRNWQSLMGAALSAPQQHNREKSRQLEAEVVLNRLTSKDHERMKHDLHEFFAELETEAAAAR